MLHWYIHSLSSLAKRCVYIYKSFNTISSFNVHVSSHLILEFHLTCFITSCKKDGDPWITTLTLLYWPGRSCKACRTLSASLYTSVSLPPDTLPSAGYTKGRLGLSKGVLMSCWSPEGDVYRLLMRLCSLLRSLCSTVTSLAVDRRKINLWTSALKGYMKKQRFKC